MYNLIEYSNNSSERSGSLWQCYKGEPNDNLTYSESTIKITGNTLADGNTKYNEIIVPLKHLSNLPSVNYDVNLISTWSSTCVITTSTGGKFYSRKVWSNRYKTLCSSCNFINSRWCKIASTTKTWL